MVFRATIVNGIIEVPEAAEFPDGSRVEVRRVRGTAQKKKRVKARRTSAKKVSKRRSPKPRTPKPRSFFESVAKYVGSVKGLPPDASLNVDHYLYGTPKR
jgi:hypothetical protein